MFKKLFTKQGLLSVFLALPFLGMALGFIPVQAASKPAQEVMLQDQKQTDTLSSLIVERLDLAKDLALYKWNNTLPIDEPENEKDLLDQIDSKLAQNFFKAQIEASKMINIENFETWVNSNIHKHEYTPDLIALEKKLKAIDEKLAIALKDIYGSFSDSQKQSFKLQLAKALQDKGFSRDVIDSATHF